MQAIHTQVELIEHVQNLLSEALSHQDVDLVEVFGNLLEKLTTGYGHLTKQTAAVSQPAQAPGWSKPKGFASSRPQPQQVARMRPPVKQEPQSYVYADGFQGVELPISTDRDDLPPSDYWEDTQG
jgi:hypothetical protein